MKCRCGWSGEGDHLCHRCHKVPGVRRFYYDGHPFSLAGAMPKFSVNETWGCDACWEAFQKDLAEHRKKLEAIRQERST